MVFDINSVAVGGAGLRSGSNTVEQVVACLFLLEDYLPVVSCWCLYTSLVCCSHFSQSSAERLDVVFVEVEPGVTFQLWIRMIAERLPDLLLAVITDRNLGLAHPYVRDSSGRWNCTQFSQVSHLLFFLRI